MNNPNRKDLRSFGLIWSIIFFIAAFVPMLKGLDVRLWALFVALAFAATTFFYPEIYSKTRFYQSWIKFGGVIGKINSKIIIAAIVGRC